MATNRGNLWKNIQKSTPQKPCRNVCNISLYKNIVFNPYWDRPASICLSVNFFLLRDHWSDFFETCPSCSPSGLVVHARIWFRCTGLSCPLGSLPPGGEDTREQLAPRGGKISRGIFTPTLGILPPTVFKIKFVFFDTNFNDK